MSSIDSVLLVGGCGFLGLHLIQKYYDISPRPQISVFDIRGLPEKLPNLFTFSRDEIKVIIGDLTSSEDVEKAILETNPTVIVHSASPVHGLPQEVYEKVNVTGTEVLLKSAKKLGVKAIVYTSSAGVVFNGQDAHNVDETWPIPDEPMDGYNETKAIAEEMVLKANSFGDDFLTVAIRPAGIFGPGDRQLIPGLRDVARLGQSKFQIGDNNNLFDWTYAGNVADAHVLATYKLLDEEAYKQVGGQAFFVTNDAPTYFWTLARSVWKHDGVIEKRNIVLPRSVAIVIGHISEFVCKFLGKQPGLTPFRVKIVCAYRYHNIEKAKRLLDYRPQVGLEDAIKLTLDWLDEK